MNEFKNVVYGKSKKMRKKFMMLSVLSFVSIFLIFGCSDNTPVDSNSTSTSKVQGSVTDNDGFQKVSSVNQEESNIQGAMVILARIKADGSLETVSNASVQTDADGKFTVETNVDGESNLVVVATKGSSEWKAVVSATVKNGLIVYAPPLNNETTVEADIYANIKASGSTNVTFADISSAINSEIAAQVKGNATAIAQLAASISAEADARFKAFTNSEIGGTQTKWQAIVNVRAQAQAQLERDLYVANGNQANIDAAFETYTNNLIVAYQNAGLDVSAYGKVYEASSRILLNSTADMNSTVKLEIQKKVALFKAKTLNFVVQSKFTTMGVSQSKISTLVSFAATLNTSIKNSVSYSAILAAFDIYQTAVINELKLTLGGNGALLTNMESDIVGFKTTLQSEVQATVSVDVVVNSYLNFYSSIKTLVQNTLTSASQVQIDATINILILLNAQF